MAIEVVAYSNEWPRRFDQAEGALRRLLDDVAVEAIEHVGSTAVSGLAAKPIIDIDVIVRREHMRRAIAALIQGGYQHEGDLGLVDREAFSAPDDDPRRHVYLCIEGTLHVRNHLAVRDVLRSSAELRERYARLKTSLARDPTIEIGVYVSGKSAVLRDVLAASGLTDEELEAIHRLNARG